jgi:subtilisin family serine protease
MKLVVSMSFGGNSSVSLMADALKAITEERHDVLLVASAGNTGDDTVSYPAGYPEVVSGGCRCAKFAA